jgi:putative serine protease PepD
MDRRSNRFLVAAAAVAVAVLGAGIGAGVYATVGPDNGTTTTVVNSVTTVDHSQQIAATSGLTVTEIYQRTNRGVVDIKVKGDSSASFGRGGGQSDTAEGSGFVYDDAGHVVTNQHVVSGATNITVRFWDGSKYPAHVIGTDRSTDLAVLKVDAPSSKLHALTLGNSDDVQVGAGVVAIGSPFGLAESVTSGIVSALHRQMDSSNGFTIGDSIQTDAPINHGNSGGPLIDASGRVIGVNAQIQSESGGSDGVGFAIPSNTVKSVVSQLLANGKVEHPYLGVGIATITDALSSQLGLPTGVEVTQVAPGGPAAHAGLRAADATTIVDGQEFPAGGDVITAVDGRRVSTSEELQSVIGAKKPGETVSITYIRDGSQGSVDVTLGTRPS